MSRHGLTRAEGNPGERDRFPCVVSKVEQTRSNATSQIEDMTGLPPRIQLVQDQGVLSMHGLRVGHLRPYKQRLMDTARTAASPQLEK